MREIDVHLLPFGGKGELLLDLPLDVVYAADLPTAGPAATPSADWFALGLSLAVLTSGQPGGAARLGSVDHQPASPAGLSRRPDVAAGGRSALERAAAAVRAVQRRCLRASARRISFHFKPPRRQRWVESGPVCPILPDSVGDPGVKKQVPRYVPCLAATP